VGSAYSAARSAWINCSLLMYDAPLGVLLVRPIRGLDQVWIALACTVDKLWNDLGQAVKGRFSAFGWARCYMVVHLSIKEISFLVNDGAGRGCRLGCSLV